MLTCDEDDLSHQQYWTERYGALQPLEP